jgi:hypothetical protein
MNEYQVTIETPGDSPGEFYEETIIVESSEDVAKVNTLRGDALRIGDTRITFESGTIKRVEKEL